MTDILFAILVILLSHEDALDRTDTIRLDDVTVEDAVRSLCYRGLLDSFDFDEIVNRADDDFHDDIQWRIDNPPCPYGDGFDHHNYWCDCY